MYATVYKRLLVPTVVYGHTTLKIPLRTAINSMTTRRFNHLNVNKSPGQGLTARYKVFPLFFYFLLLLGIKLQHTDMQQFIKAYAKWAGPH